MEADIPAGVEKYLPLIESNKRFLHLSGKITGKIRRTDSTAERVSWILFTRSAALFESVQILCSHMKSIEGLILLRSLFEVDAYLRFIWLGRKISPEELERRASWYSVSEYKEELRILHCVEGAPADFFENVVKSVHARKETILKNYKEIIKDKYPELVNRIQWYGKGLEELCRVIDHEQGGGEMLKWYNSVVRAQNWAVHASPHSASEALEDGAESAMLNHFGNKKQMLPAIVQSYLLYRHIVLKINDAFTAGLSDEITAFHKNDHEVNFQKCLGEIDRS